MFNCAYWKYSETSKSIHICEGRQEFDCLLSDLSVLGQNRGYKMPLSFDDGSKYSQSVYAYIQTEPVGEINSLYSCLF